MLRNQEDEWGNFAEALAILTARWAEIRPVPDKQSDGRKARTLANISRSYLRIIYQRERPVALPEGAWNILLDLFSAAAEGRTVSVSSACIASGGAPTTALRYLRVLEKTGLMMRVPDEKDGRRIYVAITVHGEEVARAFLTRLAEL